MEKEQVTVTKIEKKRRRDRERACGGEEDIAEWRESEIERRKKKKQYKVCQGNKGDRISLIPAILMSKMSLISCRF